MINDLNIDYGKLPPQAVELEEAVLGALISFKDAIDDVIDILTPKSFYKDEHQKIYAVLVDLNQNNKPIDVLTVTEELRRLKQLDEVGGPVYITQLSSKINSTAHLDFHAKIVAQKFIQRELIRVSSEIQNRSCDDTMDVNDLLDYSNQLMDEVNELTTGKTQLRQLNQILPETINQFKKREELAKKGKTVGIPTPLNGWNKLNGGWRNGDLIILAARPSQGKSQISLAIARTAAMNGFPVLMYNLEMTAPMLTERMIYTQAELTDQEIHNACHGYFNKDIWVKIDKAKKELSKLPIYIDDNSFVSMSYIKSHARKMKKKNLCSMIVIDYLQLADPNIKGRGISREREVADMCRRSKLMAKELDVPIILLSQLNRQLENRADKRPQLSDIRETGSAEQDPDIVTFIHRPAYYGIEVDSDGNSTEGIGILIQAKGRNIGVGETKFRHNKSLTKIWDFDEKEIIKQPTTQTKNEPIIFDDEVPF